MKDGDLSAAPTARYFVVADVVLRRSVDHSSARTGLFSRTTTERVVLVPDLAVLSTLWRWSSAVGARLELVFYGTRTTDAGTTWDLLERSAANPFSDWHVFDSPQEVQDLLPYRPDLLGIVDVPQRTAVYGGRGLTVENLR